MAGWHVPTNFVAGTVVTEAMLDDLSALLTTGAMVPLQEIVMAAPGANIDFLSIPATFRSLMLICSARGDTAAGSVTALLRFNNDSGNNYSYQYIAGNGTTPASDGQSAQNTIYLGNICAASSPAGYTSALFALIPNYVGTTLHKSTISMTGYRISTTPGASTAMLTSGIWHSAAAINRLTISPGLGNWATGSAIQLYGCPGLG